MVVIKKVGARDEMEQVYGIRREVFIDEQGVPEDIEMDSCQEEDAQVWYRRRHLQAFDRTGEG